MNLYLTLRLLLALHIIGIIVMAGTTMIDYLTFKVFWKLADVGDERSFGLLPLMARYGTFIRAGAISIIVTGVTMIALNKGVIEGQLWFKIKTVLLIALILNGLFVGNTQGTNFRNAVITHGADFVRHTANIRASLGWFYPVQLALFAIIILLSVTRLNW